MPNVSGRSDPEENREAWEYASIVVASHAGQDMMETLNNAGATGWELVSLTDSETTFGSQRLVAVVKRRIDPFAPPSDRGVGWKPDPSERHQYRWWDGEWWTFNVADGDDESRDPPTRRSPSQRVQ